MRPLLPAIFASILLIAACDDTSSSGGGSPDTAAAGDTATTPDTSTPDAAAADTAGGGHPTDTTTPGGDDIGDPKCAVPSYVECNPLCNTGCDAGEACLFVDGWKCITPGDVEAGGECDGPTECKAGACAKADDAVAATCIAPCKSDADCPEDGVCNTSITGSQPWKFCGMAPPPCDAFIAGSCPEGQACYLSGGSMTCLKEGTKLKGEDCSGSSNDCAPGLTCLNYGIVKGCARMCSTDPNADASFKCATLCGAGKFEQKDKETKTGICTEDVEFPTCDPLDSDCPAGAGCYPSEGKWICLSAGKKEKFEACGTANDCQPGLTCQAAGKCYTICDSSMHDNNPKCSSFDVKCNDIYGGFGYCSEAVGL